MRTPSIHSPAILRCALLLCAFPYSAFGQSSGLGTYENSAASTIHKGIQLVTVDVTVRDRTGQPVHGLKREDFTISEDRQTQAVRYFEENSRQEGTKSGQVLPPMPPGTFSDYTPVPSDGPLNVLLLDSLNTSMADQGYVRYQLQQYVKKVKPGTKIAIFGLSRQIVMLQGFNSDPAVLKNVVEHKLTSRASSLLEDPLGAGSTPEAPSEITADALSGQQGASSLPIASVVSNIQQFEAEQKATAIRLRTQYTLDAFNALAHYLSAFPGRKNLVWFSSSFPINILPDPSLESGAIGVENNDEELRETSSLLSQARVAVYPVDARGLMTNPTYSAASTKRDPLGKNSAAFLQAQSSEHATMNQIAEDTGGKAFYDTNDLATAVQNAVDSGSNYYTLAYTPSSQKVGYRSIRIALTGKPTAAGYTLEYRHEYFVDYRKNSPLASNVATRRTEDRSPVEEKAGYLRLAMTHGAPTPEDILFKVRVLPMSTQPEQELARNNTQNAAHPIKPPFRRFSIDIVAVPGDFQLTLGKDGHRTGALEFSVLLYDNDGSLLNTIGKAIDLDLAPDRYQQFLTGVNGHFEISVPAKAGDLFLRIGVHDISSNRIGVVEVPTSSVARLQPLHSD